MLQTNCYVLKSGAEAAVIDPGAADGRIVEALRGHNLKYILLTHAHFDHIGGVSLLKERHPQSRLCLHRGDLAIFNHFASGSEPDLLLEEGQRIEFSGEELQVLHTPGHSPGSVVFICDEKLFVGDLLFRGSIGRTDLPGGSPAEMAAALRRLMELDGDFRVYPGHGPATTLAEERISNPFLRELQEIWPPGRR
ncbi:MAG: MBL fold metallo-hydrolase [Candidatus Bipolaricaulia bacterium]